MKTVTLNETHYSTTEVSDESTYRGSLVLLPDISYLNNLYVFDQISYKNEKNMSCISNDDQKPSEIWMNADYSSDPLFISVIFKKFDENVSVESNPNDLISSTVDPHHLVSSSELFIQCAKYVLNRVTLTVTWEYEDPILFRGG
ncbi:hypothetical protein MS3_00000057 [Schistosoma haematobium]|uniref:Uncharacterized protein n=1 Tax=Schistosoma haematobium TaxID=6185 RepID=A0A922ITK3_SCHHA|nr:hypothetical protein MS3_00000057 [Schistosoma haematobium]KAH9587275.1 hypothetical protein MS3_00000057 [Schistosoma haematobium]